VKYEETVYIKEMDESEEKKGINNLKTIQKIQQ
jgi:hypothetical protein